MQPNRGGLISLVRDDIARPNRTSSMPHPTHRYAAILVVATALLTPMRAWAAFTCPASDVSTTGTQPDLSAVATPGDGPSVTKPVMSAVDDMREQGIKSGMIVDRLVAAYCVRVAGEGVSDEQKATQVGRFASSLANYIYRGVSSKEEDVVVDVSVPTKIFDELQQAVKKAGVTQDAWVNQAIRSRLMAH